MISGKRIDHLAQLPRIAKRGEMIEKRWPNHVEASIIEASHESDILILGNRIPLQAIALLRCQTV
jgi:hypothetical protein